jgi:hypothetical protein
MDVFGLRVQNAFACECRSKLIPPDGYIFIMFAGIAAVLPRINDLAESLTQIGKYVCNLVLFHRETNNIIQPHLLSTQYFLSQIEFSLN